MGAAGDMLAAALLELLPDPEKWIQQLNALGIPGVHFRREQTIKCGISGTQFFVTVCGEQEEEHRHHPHNHHPHRGMKEIEEIVFALNLSSKIKEEIMHVYACIAEAESHVHNVPVTQIHFHEVGAMDAIADITAVCILMEELSPDEVIVSPIHVGSGQVVCAHGILPVPAPATAYLLKGIPVYGGSVKGELCTPTGAALLKHFASRFGEMPLMKVHAIGYGMGKKEFDAVNCVRAMIGEAEGESDVVLELLCNVDDMTAEAIAFAAEQLLDAGALDVYTIPIGMKKSRPGTLIGVICGRQEREKMIPLLFAHTTTLGIRESVKNRYRLNREIHTLQTSLGNVQYKISSGYGITQCKFEYDDLSRIAKEQHLTLDDVRKIAESQRGETPLEKK